MLFLLASPLVWSAFVDTPLMFVGLTLHGVIMVLCHQVTSEHRLMRMWFDECCCVQPKTVSADLALNASKVFLKDPLGWSNVEVARANHKIFTPFWILFWSVTTFFSLFFAQRNSLATVEVHRMNGVHLKFKHLFLIFSRLMSNAHWASSRFPKLDD